MNVRSVGIRYHQSVPVPAGKGTAIYQGKTENDYLLTQNSEAAGFELSTWRLMYFPRTQMGPFAYIRFHGNNGEKCQCGQPAVGSWGTYQDDEFIDIHDVCQGCLEEAINAN